ncbi:Cell wall biosynthesis-associated protein [Bifidobacterium dolichotidis]|uniref:Cell wall biosynthesis-associated protein n=2 Tax=Bifidobacterium dolichotidis TaxID=2306976 RepID=A0A430FS60_9BIFI|nr:Cell wall biosynthesis-associated protein [Bifidobacterium dolichotidis]
MIIERVPAATMEQEAQNLGLDLPIEQTAVWADYQSEVPGRTPWGSLLVRDSEQEGKIVAVISLIRMDTHGYSYLRAGHGPVWQEKPTQQQEQQFIDALVKFVRTNDRHIAFLRIDTWYDHANVKPVLSTVPYSETVVVDLTGTEDDILSRMKKRGRRDVRKAMRESPAEIQNETAQALADFTEYYKVMVDTAQRDGFAPAPMSDYIDMLTKLGKNARLYAARVNGEVHGWTIITTHGKSAVYYYACMASDARGEFIPDKMLLHAMLDLNSEGFTKFDLMGIGNDFAPSLKSLNGFKTKFAKDTTVVAAGHDIPLHKCLYSMLTMMKSVRDKLRSLKHHEK